ncbi:hypothetical protein JOD54_006212 [Actinokineospora baliensis]|uniref:hypothetical protein n=1 Tax=Actinokineospora baliensis TaxID=547056 RepID=UPI00195CA7C0|nr:hypothetical protein [Actinokineospora baliensis]MBM7776008.1 hypothetical protein [Actinokineospora baliensis]
MLTRSLFQLSSGLALAVKKVLERPFTISASSELENYAGCAYVEDRIKGHYYEEVKQITTYRNAPSRLRVLAINPTESPAYIHRLMKDL